MAPRTAVRAVPPVAEPDGLEIADIPPDETDDTGEVSLEQLEEQEEVDRREGEDEEAQLEELVEEPEVDTDEHEVELDALLALQFAPAADDEGTGEAELAADGVASVDPLEVPPAAPYEFVCASCFLIKHRRQMTDTARRLCADCAASS